jgi:hypothetical protein
LIKEEKERKKERKKKIEREREGKIYMRRWCER